MDIEIYFDKHQIGSSVCFHADMIC